MTDSLPDLLARAAEELGEPIAVYTVGPTRVGVKLLVAFGLLLYGVVGNLLWWVIGPARFDHLVLLLLFAPPLSGLSMLRHLLRVRGLTVATYPNGLLIARGQEIHSFPWDELSIELQADAGEVHYERGADERLTACWIEVEPPLVRFWQASVTLYRSDGVEATLTPALSRYTELLEAVQRQTFAAQWEHCLTQMLTETGMDFGPFRVSAEGIMFGDDELPWPQIGAIEISQGKLSIKLSGKWLPWAMAELSDVRNPHLFLAAVEELRRWAAIHEPRIEES